MHGYKWPINSARTAMQGAGDGGWSGAAEVLRLGEPGEEDEFDVMQR